MASNTSASEHLPLINPLVVAPSVDDGHTAAISMSTYDDTWEVINHKLIGLYCFCHVFLLTCLAQIAPEGTVVRLLPTHHQVCSLYTNKTVRLRFILLARSRTQSTNVMQLIWASFVRPLLQEMISHPLASIH